LKHVLLLLAQGFEEYEASVFTDVLGWSRVSGDIPVHVTTAGLHSQIKGTWNLTVIPQIHLKDIIVDDYDALAIPGGFEEAGFYEDAFQEDFLDVITTFNNAGKIIASICVGALPLGKSGILDGRKATTYHLQGGRWEQLAEFGVEVLNQHIVIDNNIISSSCPGTAIAVAFKLLEMLTTTENCDIVKRDMGFDLNII